MELSDCGKYDKYFVNYNTKWILATGNSRFCRAKGGITIGCKNRLVGNLCTFVGKGEVWVIKINYSLRKSVFQISFPCIGIQGLQPHNDMVRCLKQQQNNQANFFNSFFEPAK